MFMCVYIYIYLYIFVSKYWSKKTCASTLTHVRKLLHTKQTNEAGQQGLGGCHRYWKSDFHNDCPFFITKKKLYWYQTLRTKTEVVGFGSGIWTWVFFIEKKKDSHYGNQSSSLVDIVCECRQTWRMVFAHKAQQGENEVTQQRRGLGDAFRGSYKYSVTVTVHVNFICPWLWQPCDVCQLVIYFKYY